MVERQFSTKGPSNGYRFNNLQKILSNNKNISFEIDSENEHFIQNLQI